MAATHSQPNIIVILADDLGYGDLSCFGNDKLNTPNLDFLYTNGVHLTQHYTGSPICAPARASFLTGQYNHRTGALSVESNRGLDRINPNVPLIGEYIAANGYATGMVGKWHNGAHDRLHHPNQRGFSEFIGFLNGGMNYFDWILDYNDQPVKSDGRYLTDVFTAEANAFVTRHRDHPFFLYLAYNAPHPPFEAPAEAIERYRALGTLDEGVCRIYAMIERMDQGIGQLLQTLRDQGLEDNTLVLFTSDNGPLLRKVGGYDLARFNGPFRGGKTSVLEGGIRVPAMLYWPDGLSAGQMSNDMIHFTDWLPTLLELAGVRTEGIATDGLSCLQTLQGRASDRPDQRYWQFNRYEPVARCNAAMRDGKWKLYWPDIPEAMKKLPSDTQWYKQMMSEPHSYLSISNPEVVRDLPAPGLPQLYDLVADPMESSDLAQSFPDVTSRMTLQLDNWFEQIEAERKSLLAA
jgi:arylsulfatase A-like enzyme